MRERIQENLIFIDIDDEDTKDLMEKVYEQDEKNFDIYFISLIKKQSYSKQF